MLFILSTLPASFFWGGSPFRCGKQAKTIDSGVEEVNKTGARTGQSAQNVVDLLTSMQISFLYILRGLSHMNGVCISGWSIFYPQPRRKVLAVMMKWIRKWRHACMFGSKKQSSQRIKTARSLSCLKQMTTSFRSLILHRLLWRRGQSIQHIWYINKSKILNS